MIRLAVQEALLAKNDKELAEQLFRIDWLIFNYERMINYATSATNS